MSADVSADAASPYYPARMGLEPLPPEAWLLPQPGDGALLRLRAQLIEAHGPEVIAALPEADAAVAELMDELRRRGYAIAQTAGGPTSLEALGRAVAEDICVLTEKGGGFRLTAGVLCFPNRWRLCEKIGGSVLDVHGPVPDYAEHLSIGVDRFLARLKPARAYLRRNWGLSSSSALFLPAPTPPVDPRHDADIFFRREDQSFFKLPNTGAVIFAIRTAVTPWADMPELIRAEILAMIDALHPAWLDYKSIKPVS